MGFIAEQFRTFCEERRFVLSDKVIHIKDLKYDKKNARIHTEKGISTLIDGLQEVGAGRSILIDKDNEIVCGNGLVESAAAAGFTKVRVIETDGTEVIAVKRKDLVGKKKQRMALLDNRAAEFSAWNTDVLKDILHEDENSLKGLWGEDELTYLLEKEQLNPNDPISPESEKNKPQETPIERVILWVPSDQHADFQAKIRALGDAYGQVDITEIVMTAVNRQYDIER